MSEIRLKELDPQEVVRTRTELVVNNLFYMLKHVETIDEDIKSYRKFPVHYKYLHDVNAAVDQHKRVVILKSRRLLISWLGMMRQLHQAMMCGVNYPGTTERVLGSHDIFRGGVMSVGETEAQYLIERATHAYKSLPKWMKALNPLITDNKLLMKFRSGGIIQAFPMKREGPQTFGFSEVFFDEMALQEAARSTWTGMIPTLGEKGIVFAVSTPNGKQNFFHKIWKNKNNQFPGLKRITIHWTENPEHNNPAWIKSQRDNIDDQAYARMYELSFSHAAGDRVYPEFTNANVSDYTKIIKARPILIGWDFGYHYPAAVIGQRNSLDQFIIHREVVDYQVSFDTFCEKVKAACEAIFDLDETDILHFIDPAGFQRYHNKAAGGAVSDAHQIRMTFRKYKDVPVQIRAGALGVGTKDNEGPRTKEVRKIIKVRGDNRLGLYVNKRCEELVDGFNGGYCYPEKGHTDQPEKNEYSHPHDALGYLITGFLRVFTYRDSNKYKKKQATTIGHKTGQ